MIRRWQIKNFKSIKKDMDFIEFAPITVFAGANSSGKSSVIQSILLIMQSFTAVDNATLLLNGELVTLGTVEDVWNYEVLTTKNKIEPLVFQIEINDPQNEQNLLAVKFQFNPSRGINVELAYAEYIFKHYEQSEVLEDILAIEHYRRGYRIVQVTPDLEMSIIKKLEERGLKEVQPLLHANIEIEGLFPRTIDVQAKVPTTDLNWDVALIRPFDERFVPSDFDELIEDKHKRILRRIVKQENLPGFMEEGNRRQLVELVKNFGAYREWFQNLSVKQAEVLVKALTPYLKELLVDERVTQKLPYIERIEQSVIRLALRNIRYLGANRIGPTIIFSPDVTSQWSEVGINGANVATALKEHGNKQIRWYDPENFELKSSSLLEALLIWLRFFNLLDGVDTEEQGKLGTMLKIRSVGVGRQLDLTSVGFGTSQLLPILVQGLLTPPNGIFIVEQPEVHLHPHIQSQLAIFFIALSKAGVQCVIETHSENLVNQLRLFIANRRHNLRRHIKMYFAHRDIEYGTAFEEVEINRNGVISNWPAGFMDESTRQAEAMLRALLADEE